MEPRSVLTSQYGASLAMLRQAVADCPPAIWLDTTHANAYWHLAYHALFYAHLYASPGESAFTPWVKHQEESQYLGPLPWPPHDAPKSCDPYAQNDVLNYADQVSAYIREAIPDEDLSGESGFHWLPFTRLEVHLYNIRHMQHHVGQLADRLRRATGQSVAWVGIEK